MRIRKILVSFTFFIILLSLIPIVEANPVVNYYYYYSFISYIVVCFIGYFSTIGIEYLISFGFIHRTQAEKKRFFKGILITNSITYPLAQLLVLIFFLVMVSDYLVLVILSVEVIVIFLEWFLLFTWLNRQSKNGDMNFVRNVSNFRVFIHSIIANILSFLFGSLMFLAIFPVISIFYLIF